MPSQIRVDSITDLNGTGVVELTHGASFPSGSKLTHNGNINIVGVATIGLLSATDMNVSGIVTASSFVGDGSQLQGVQSVSESKSIALKVILDPLPFRS